MKNQKIPLPIDAHCEEILTKIRKSSTILIKASPGSGKTTRLPWFIAKNLSGKVLVLEPRRLAARLAAERIASEEQFKLGEEVGYHFRFENKTSPYTRVIFYTEGTFLRLLVKDPSLKDVSVVILDEFHERHLETDMALAYLLGLKTNRPDLKIILMSATLDTKILGQLTDSSVIEIEAPHYPVEVSYLPNVPSELNRPLEQKIRQSLEASAPQADTLIFLPGMKEILKVKEYLADRYGKVMILHSEAPKEEQEEALRPSHLRKIILSTNIAESSLTIPGIVNVIDSGVQRMASYSPWNGLKFVSDHPVTKASAIQRAGRAGRTSPGFCHRLYSLQDFNSRLEHTVAEIERADLTDAYLLSAELPGKLIWPTPPALERWNKARDLSFALGITDESEKLTAIGKKIQKYPLDVRLSRILVEGEKLTKESRKKLLQYLCREVERDQFGILEKRLSSYLDFAGASEEPWEKSMVSGFIDQVARFRPKQSDFIHYSGKTIKSHYGKDLHGDFFLILDISQKQEAVKVLSIEEEWLYDHIPFPFTEEINVEVSETFKFKSQTKIGSIVTEETAQAIEWSKLKASQRQKVLELAKRPFEKRLEEWRNGSVFERLHFWGRLKKFDMVEEEKKLTLLSYLEQTSVLSWDKLEAYLQQVLETNLAVSALNQTLPLKVNFGAKRGNMKVHYPLNNDPFVEAPIQDFYGVKETPKIAGSIPLTLKLLGPHKMPIQVTKDLAGFWQKTYGVIKKELQRDYPRHHWPDHPESAEPFLLKSHRI